MAGWIGVDLDGTLAYHTPGESVNEVGAPIPAMVDRVRKWLSSSQDVRIFTARVSGSGMDKAYQKSIIDAWCKQQFGQALPLTNCKDGQMTELWDDKAIQVIPNTGRRADGKA